MSTSPTVTGQSSTPVTPVTPSPITPVHPGHVPSGPVPVVPKVTSGSKVTPKGSKVTPGSPKGSKVTGSKSTPSTGSKSGQVTLKGLGLYLGTTNVPGKGPFTLQVPNTSNTVWSGPMSGVRPFLKSNGSTLHSFSKSLMGSKEVRSLWVSLNKSKVNPNAPKVGVVKV